MPSTQLSSAAASTSIGSPAPLSVFPEIDVEGLLASVDGPVGYALVFLLAAIPWLEILVVIPTALAVGLDPLPVALFALLGNLLPIYAIVVGWRRVSAWLDRRRDPDAEPSARRKRAKRVWDRYGLPGLALASPILTGAHLAAVLALGFGSRGRDVNRWMTVSLIGWTAVTTAAFVAGLSLL